MLQELLPPLIWLLELTAVALSLGGAWRTFARAGQPGWAALVPLYNAVVLARAARREGWTLLLFVPVVNVIAYAAVCVALARRFGKRAPFGLGLFALPFVFWPLLGAGDPLDPRAGRRLA